MNVKFCNNNLLQKVIKKSISIMMSKRNTPSQFLWKKFAYRKIPLFGNSKNLKSINKNNIFLNCISRIIRLSGRSNNWQLICPTLKLASLNEGGTLSVSWVPPLGDPISTT